MISTMIVFGAALGRWWKSALILAAIVWPIILLWDGALQRVPNSHPLLARVSYAALFGVVNAAIGVGLHQLVLHLIRKSRSKTKVT